MTIFSTSTTRAISSSLVDTHGRKPVGIYSPGYVAEELEEQPMVDNPKVKELKREKASRATELHKLKLQLADWVLKQTDNAGLEDLKKTKIQLLADIVGID